MSGEMMKKRLMFKRNIVNNENSVNDSSDVGNFPSMYQQRQQQQQLPSSILNTSTTTTTASSVDNSPSLDQLLYSAASLANKTIYHATLKDQMELRKKFKRQTADGNDATSIEANLFEKGRTIMTPENTIKNISNHLKLLAKTQHTYSTEDIIVSFIKIFSIVLLLIVLLPTSYLQLLFSIILIILIIVFMLFRKANVSFLNLHQFNRQNFINNNIKTSNFNNRNIGKNENNGETNGNSVAKSSNSGNDRLIDNNSKQEKSGKNGFITNNLNQ